MCVVVKEEEVVEVVVVIAIAWRMPKTSNAIKVSKLILFFVGRITLLLRGAKSDILLILYHMESSFLRICTLPHTRACVYSKLSSKKTLTTRTRNPSSSYAPIHCRGIILPGWLTSGRNWLWIAIGFLSRMNFTWDHCIARMLDDQRWIAKEICRLTRARKYKSKL